VSFSFSPLQRFIGSITVPPASIKWSISSNTSQEGFNLSYTISLPNGSSLPSASFFPNTTSQVTTYYIPLEGDLYALLEVFQSALVDNISLPISHSFQASTLLLQFPPFNSSLFYDPSIRLAELTGGGKSSSNHDPLIIGAVVGGSVALLMVLGILLVAMATIKIRGRKKKAICVLLSWIKINYK